MLSSPPLKAEVELAVNVGIGTLLVSAVMAAQLSRLAVPWRYRELFEQVARETGEDENLLHAIAWHESNLNAAAVSAPNRNGTRDYGLSQINEINFRTLGLDTVSALDAGKNVRAAARLLKMIRAQGATSLPDVLAIYNAGRGAGGARLTPSGAYINSVYVVAVLSRYAWVQLAALAPVQKLAAV